MNIYWTLKLWGFKFNIWIALWTIFDSTRVSELYSHITQKERWKMWSNNHISKWNHKCSWNYRIIDIWICRDDCVWVRYHCYICSFQGTPSVYELLDRLYTTNTLLIICLHCKPFHCKNCRFPLCSISHCSSNVLFTVTQCMQWITAVEVKTQQSLHFLQSNTCSFWIQISAFFVIYLFHFCSPASAFLKVWYPLFLLPNPRTYYYQMEVNLY